MNSKCPVLQECTWYWSVDTSYKSYILAHLSLAHGMHPKLKNEVTYLSTKEWKPTYDGSDQALCTLKPSKGKVQMPHSLVSPGYDQEELKIPYRMKRTEGTWLGISFPGWGPTKRQDSRVLLPLTWCKIRRNIHEETDVHGPKTAPWNDYSPLVAAGTCMDQSRKPEEKCASQQILEWINDANPGLDTSWDIPPSMWTGAVMGKTGIDQYLVSSTGLLWRWVGHACVLGNHICWDFLLLVSRSTVHAGRWALRIMLSQVGIPLVWTFVA